MLVDSSFDHKVKVTSSVIIILKNRGFPWTATGDSNFQTLKKVQIWGKQPFPHYQKAGYGPATDTTDANLFMHYAIATLNFI